MLIYHFFLPIRLLILYLFQFSSKNRDSSPRFMQVKGTGFRLFHLKMKNYLDLNFSIRVFLFWGQFLNFENDVDMLPILLF